MECFLYSVEHKRIFGQAKHALTLYVVCGKSIVRRDARHDVNTGHSDELCKLGICHTVYYGAYLIVNYQLVGNVFDRRYDLAAFLALVGNKQQMRYLIHNAALDLLNAGTLMLLDKANASRQFIDYFLEENHIHASNLIEITTMDLLIEFARTGLGIACVIRDFVADDLKSGLLVEIPTPQTIHPREIGFAWKRGRSSHRFPCQHTV